MTDIVQKLWGFCHTLRHDSVDYGDYIEQITYLLFLKMADERSVQLPKGCDWPTLADRTGTALVEFYTDLLRKLGRQPGILGDIYAKSQSRFNNPVNLKRLINLIAEPEWTSLGVDVKAEFYDARSNVPGITKKDRPLSPEHFAEFEKCYGAEPNGRAKRKDGDSPATAKGYLGGDRWRCFTLAEVQEREFKLDSFKWLKDDSLEDADDLPPPEELATDAIGELETAVEELNAVLTLLENGNGANGKGAKKRP